MNSLTNSTLLITGGTGSIGKELTRQVLENYDVRKLIIFSRDELKQAIMREEFNNNGKLRWLLGDIRDLQRLRMAFHQVTHLIHAAALKRVDTGEYNPSEFIKTNILGSQNVVDAAIESNVKKVIALSTDKASSPINLYGATKLTADKLFISANNYGKPKGTAFSVVRYGNVMGSRGSVIPFFKEIATLGKKIPITDYRMTRFWISIEHAANFILNSFEIMNGGELYVPKIPSMKIIDLAKAISPNSEIYETGIRPGEKLHEEMISEDDSRRTYILEDRYVVTPVISDWGFNVPENVRYMQDGKAYRSDSNDLWLTEKDIGTYLMNSTIK